MILFRRLLILVLLVSAVNAYGAANEREPHIGYLYPAGGQQGTTLQITVGGQFLREANEVYISGDGVKGSVVKYIGRVKPLNGDQRRELQRQLAEIQRKRQGGNKPLRPDVNRPADINKPAEPNKTADANNPKVTLPEHPLLKNLDKLSPKGLQKVREEFLSNKFPASAQIGEILIIEIDIDPNAEPGDRELRLGTRLGLTNPVCFQVGILPEIREPEFQDAGKPVTPKFQIPAIINGQILPGETDHFRFSARQGQKLTIDAKARQLIPFLADAVPGWFQITIAINDSRGKELAYADEFRFYPDPVLFYKIPRDGDYELEIHDSINRGREDFVYRVCISELPFITQIFPLGGQTGSGTIASISGWNLDTNELLLDTGPAGSPVRQAQISKNNKQSNRVPYMVDSLPQCDDVEENYDVNTSQRCVYNSQRITIPRIINGRIGKPGDIDVFRIDGNEGDEVVAEVYARRLNSPLDSILWVTDENEQTLYRNDDSTDKNIGLLTSQNSDSYLRFTLPKAGPYFVHLADSQSHGGQEYGYRLRISRPIWDFALFITPSSINVPVGGTVAVAADVLRKDGFNGEIELALKDAPAGFKLSGAKIPAGCDHIRLTLTAPTKSSWQPVKLQFEGMAQIASRKVTRPVTPAEDMMQAFAYHHLMPEKECLVSVLSNRRPAPAFEIASDDIVRIPIEGSVEVRFKTPKKFMPEGIHVELSDAPAGLTIQDANFDNGEMKLVLKTDDKVKAGTIDNLIIDVFMDPPKNPQGNQKRQQQRAFIGTLPAIPFEITQQPDSH